MCGRENLIITGNGILLGILIPSSRWRLWLSAKTKSKNWTVALCQNCGYKILRQIGTAMDTLILVKPSKELEKDIWEYRQEHFTFGETYVNGRLWHDKLY